MEKEILWGDDEYETLKSQLPQELQGRIDFADVAEAVVEKAKQEGYKLIITDTRYIKTPSRFQGPSVVAKIRKFDKSIPIVAVSTAMGDEVRKTYEEVGVTEIKIGKDNLENTFRDLIAKYIKE